MIILITDCQIESHSICPITIIKCILPYFLEVAQAAQSTERLAQTSH